MGYKIELEKISKIYPGVKENKTALKNISLSLLENKIYGLIGANGAGKTTLLKLIANYIYPSEGEIRFNETTLTEDSKIQQDICLMGDQQSLFESYNSQTLFKIASYFYPQWDGHYAQRLIEVFELNTKKEYGKMSKGEKGKANIILALASKSKITIFDETYVSLDAPSRKKFFDLLIEDYTEYPRTIIISTHYIDEVSKLFEEIILLDRGQMLVHETKDSLEEKTMTILGDKKTGKNLLAGINIIYEESFGSQCAFSIYDTLPKTLRKQLKDQGFQISITPVEKWFIQMISQEGLR